MVSTYYPKDGKNVRQAMKYTMNKTLFIILPNLTCFKRKEMRVSYLYTWYINRWVGPFQDVQSYNEKGKNKNVSYLKNNVIYVEIGEVLMTTTLST